MFSHRQIWQAMDGLASRHGLSASGLAKLAGLDPTTFNKSKRATGGKLRWPSTESVSKALAAVGASLDDLVALLEPAPHGGGRPVRRIPLIGLMQAGGKGVFDDAGLPAGAGWDEIGFPECGDRHAYALEVTGDPMMPVYRDGDRIVVSPASSLRRGDRVVVRMSSGEVMARQLGRMTAQRVELRSLNPSVEHRYFQMNEIAFIHRIIWASQ